MLQPKVSSIESNQNGSNSTRRDHLHGVPQNTSSTPTIRIDIQAELDRLEEMLLSSLRIPLTGRTLVDEDKLLEHLDLIRLGLPTAFQEALDVLAQKQEILLEAEEYGQQVVDVAQAKRAQILSESDIIKQAQREADQLRRQVQQDCEAMMQETLDEIDRKRRTCQQELEEMRQSAIAQAQEIEDGADQYADTVLGNIEQDIQSILQIVTNGRKQLRGDNSSQRHSNNPKKR
ncbi:MAG: DivIVA domain-containing protein [Cuspidothrix sp.]